LRPADAPALAPSDGEVGSVVAAAIRGDAAALAALYRRFAPVVHGVLLARVGPAEVDDLTQEVFVVAMRRLPDVRTPEAFPGWICAVARNAATDHLRRRSRLPAREALPDVAASSPPGDGAELRARALAAIQGLPEAYREPLVLRLVEGLTGPEIAERTGLAPGSVRVNLCRGLALLRPLLRKEGWR